MYNRSLYFSLLLLNAYSLAFSELSIKVLEENDVRDFCLLEAQIIHPGADACISKVSDGETTYILKQINDASLDEQFLLINDCIASTIGYEAGVPVNQVVFIPYNVGAHLKVYSERAATLHSFIPGKDLESESPRTIKEEFSLQQRAKSPWQKQVSDEEQGLTKNVIESMSYHNSLPLIAAFDTFFGNSDRSLPNLFYDKNTDFFYGIDHAAAFTKKLPLYSCDRLKSLISESYVEKCPETVLESLALYQSLLAKLQHTVYSEKIYDAMVRLATYLAPHAEDDKVIHNRIRHHFTTVENNSRDTTELIVLLNKLLSQ